MTKEQEETVGKAKASLRGARLMLSDDSTNSNLTKTNVEAMISQAEEFIALAEQMLGALLPAADQS